MKQLAIFIFALLTSFSSIAEPAVQDAIVFSLEEGKNTTTAVVSIEDENILTNPLVSARTSYAQLALVEKPEDIPLELKHNLIPIKGMAFNISLSELLKPIQKDSTIDFRLVFKNGEVLNIQARVLHEEN